MADLLVSHFVYQWLAALLITDRQVDRQADTQTDHYRFKLLPDVLHQFLFIYLTNNWESKITISSHWNNDHELNVWKWILQYYCFFEKFILEIGLVHCISKISKCSSTYCWQALWSLLASLWLMSGREISAQIKDEIIVSVFNSSGVLLYVQENNKLICYKDSCQFIDDQLYAVLQDKNFFYAHLNHYICIWTRIIPCIHQLGYSIIRAIKTFNEKYWMITKKQG